MQDSSVDNFVLETSIAHPLMLRVDIKVSLTDEVARRVKMGIRPFVDSVGMHPEEARELAAKLVEFADQADRPARSGPAPTA